MNQYNLTTIDNYNNVRECTFSTLNQVSEYLTSITGTKIDVNVCRKILTNTLSHTFYDNSGADNLFKMYPHVSIEKTRVVQYNLNERFLRKCKVYYVSYDGVLIFESYCVGDIANKLKLSIATVYRIINGYYNKERTAEKSKQLQRYTITVEEIDGYCNTNCVNLDNNPGNPENSEIPELTKIY